MRPAFEYTARLVPVDKISFVSDPLLREEVVERFDRYCFSSAAAHPENVAVTLEHPQLEGRRREIGRLRSLRVEDGWWVGKFRVSPEANASDRAVASDILRVGRPCSIGFTPIKESRFGDQGRGTDHLMADLNEVAVVQVGASAYKEACIIRARDLAADPRAPFTMAPDLAAKLRAHGVDVPEPRPEPRPVSSAEGERFFEQPWVRQAQKLAARRGALIRPGGSITAVR